MVPTPQIDRRATRHAVHVASDRKRFPEKRRASGAPGSSGYTQDVVVLNDFSGVTYEQRTRTSPSGKTSVRYSLSVEAEPLLNNLDGVYLGTEPAAAIRDLLEMQTRDIGEFAKKATIDKRKAALNAYHKGKSWAIARYSGGRTGPMYPMAADTKRIGLDSGRLAAGWYVMQNAVEQSFSINVPANRFEPSTWGGSIASLNLWVSRFVSLIPALREPKSILENDKFIRAVGRSKPVEVLNWAASHSKWRDYVGAAIKGLRRGGIKLF